MCVHVYVNTKNLQKILNNLKYSYKLHYNNIMFDV